MNIKIAKWGNSYAVRIPKGILNDSGLKQGSLVNIISEKGGLSLRPIKKKVYSLKELVKKITPENRHEEVDWGGPVGNEIW